MTLAARLGMHLHDFMGWPGPMTMRQLEAWREWEFADANSPGGELGVLVPYLQQLAVEIIRGRAKDPAGVDMKHARLKFTRPKPAKRLTKEQVAEQSKKRWGIKEMREKARAAAADARTMHAGADEAAERMPKRQRRQVVPRPTRDG